MPFYWQKGGIYLAICFREIKNQEAAGKDADVQDLSLLASIMKCRKRGIENGLLEKLPHTGR